MKKLILIIYLIFTTPAIGQYTLFNENIGTGTGTASIASNIFQNTALSFSGTADTRTSTPSTYIGASEGKNIFITNMIGRNFQISNISTIGLFNMQLTFGALKSTTTSNMSELILEFSINGSTYTAITIPTQATGSGTAIWRLISIPLPTAAHDVSNLRLRWRQTSAGRGRPQFRLDDIKLTYETALPIELIEFSGHKTNSYNIISWKTASEHNNSHFILERSSTGGFTENDVIAVLVGAGNSQQLISYSHADINAPKEVNYYKLTQVDFDGYFESFDIIYIDNTEKNKKIIKTINLLGYTISSQYSGYVIDVYDDGTLIKRLQ